MCHTTWLQNWTPTHALDGRTPYKMQNKKKPYLGGIQEFGVAAYMKDLKAGKLDARFKSAGLSGMIPSQRDIGSIGLKNAQLQLKEMLFLMKMTYKHLKTMQLSKVICWLRGRGIKSSNNPPTTSKTPKNLTTNQSVTINLRTKQPNHTKTLNLLIQSLFHPHLNQHPKLSQKLKKMTLLKAMDKAFLCPRKPPGAYKDLNDGLVAAVICSNLEDEDKSVAEIPEDNDRLNSLPPNFALVGSTNSDPCTLDEALRGPDAKFWQTALEYEISQLEKLGTWVVEDLPTGHTAIPCSEVLKVKRGPNGEIQSYHVRIVTGGHRQV